MSHIGYRIYIQELKMPSRVFLRNTPPVRITFANDGDAPMYYRWQAPLHLIDQNGEIRSSIPAPMDVRKILPGKLHTVDFSVPIKGIPDGEYGIGFAILDPSTRAPAVRLAMVNPRTDLIQVLRHVKLFWRP